MTSSTLQADTSSTSEWPTTTACSSPVVPAAFRRLITELVSKGRGAVPAMQLDKSRPAHFDQGSGSYEAFNFCS